MKPEQEIIFGNIILAEMGMPPMNAEQEKKFLAKRQERLAATLTHSYPAWMKGLFAIAGASLLVGYLTGKAYGK